jgi:hypothetical protein
MFGLFRPLKVSWREVLKIWFRESRIQTVDKAVFPSLLRKLWQTLKPEHVAAGFQGSGLFPVSKEAVQAYLFLHQMLCTLLQQVKDQGL